MTNNNIIFIGLDTHKVSTQVAYCEDVRGAEVFHLGKINTNKQSFVKLARKLQSKYPKATLHFVYEAGPCGYWIYRLLSSLAHCCYIVPLLLSLKKPCNKLEVDKRCGAPRRNK